MTATSGSKRIVFQARLVGDGRLRAAHRQNPEPAKGRTEAQHGDSWLITEEAAVAFIKRNPYDLDLRKVVQFWFLDLVTAWLHDPPTLVGAAGDIWTVINSSYEAIEKDKLPQVSASMNGYLMGMIGADPDDAIIQRAEVTPDYDIAVYGPQGQRLDPDRHLNGASRRALTLACILALSEVRSCSGRIGRMGHYLDERR